MAIAIVYATFGNSESVRIDRLTDKQVDLHVDR